MAVNEGREYELDARSSAELLRECDHEAFMAATMTADGYVQTGMHFEPDYDGLAYPAPAIMVAAMVDRIAEAEGVAFETAMDDVYMTALEIGGGRR